MAQDKLLGGVTSKEQFLHFKIIIRPFGMESKEVSNQRPTKQIEHDKAPNWIFPNIGGLVVAGLFSFKMDPVPPVLPVPLPSFPLDWVDTSCDEAILPESRKTSLEASYSFPRYQK